jgi:ribosomal protein L30/L7E
MEVMKNRIRVTLNLLRLQRIIFMLEQEEVKLPIAIVSPKE